MALCDAPRRGGRGVERDTIGRDATMVITTGEHYFGVLCGTCGGLILFLRTCLPSGGVS